MNQGWSQKLELRCRCGASPPRLPTTHPWGNGVECNPEHPNAIEAQWQSIQVGNSRRAVRTVSLPALGMVCDPIAQNPQQSHWRDHFELTTNGDELSVKRLDVN